MQHCEIQQISSISDNDSSSKQSDPSNSNDFSGNYRGSSSKFSAAMDISAT